MTILLPDTKKLLVSSLASLLAVACSNDRAMERPPLDQLAHVVLAEMEQPDALFARCGPKPGGATEKMLLVVVSEEVCLGCLNMGWFIREFGRTIHRNVTVVAARSIEDLACDFVVREKTGAALALVRDSVLGRWQPLEVPIVIDVASDGSIRGAFSSRDLPGLLALMAEVADSPSTSTWRQFE